MTLRSRGLWPASLDGAISRQPGSAKRNPGVATVGRWLAPWIISGNGARRGSERSLTAPLLASLRSGGPPSSAPIGGRFAPLPLSARPWYQRLSPRQGIAPLRGGLNPQSLALPRPPLPLTGSLSAAGARAVAEAVLGPPDGVGRIGGVMRGVASDRPEKVCDGCGAMCWRRVSEGAVLGCAVMSRWRCQSCGTERMVLLFPLPGRALPRRPAIG